ncbi:histidine kinase domain-containing protein [Pandoravirus kuranda]|uniref:Histidine kinase domain-containing protein n=1 Tax=Pandoravirus kuranda TaxID=3019033 RepID=A0AA95EDQ0_9VIRU|nr:histidine kinase domain-containing protein [Pandoravirus kuranda]
MDVQAGEGTTKHGRQKFKQVFVAATSADPQTLTYHSSTRLYGPPDAEGWDPLPFRKEDERYARSVSVRTKPHH